MRSLPVRASALAAFAVLALATPAAAQYFGGYDRPPPPDEYGPPRRYDPYDRPPPPAYRRAIRAGACVTGRGVCPAPGVPYGYPCRCMIPGFGPKRGIVQ